MRLVPRALLAGGLGFAVSWLAACGGGAGLLSGDQASTLSGQLDAVTSAVQTHDCPGAASAVAGLSNAVANLPTKVSPTLRSNLLQGAQTVGVLSAKDCHTTTTTSSTTSSSKSSSSSTTSSTTSSSSSPSTTSASTTTPATSTGSTGTTPSGGGGLGGGSTSTTSNGGGSP